MYSMELNNNETTNSSSRWTFYCRYAPNISWEVSGSTFNLITGLIKVIASHSTVILNALVILAIKQRKELQKPSNILLSGLAVTDLPVGVIVMPTSATVDFFILSQVSFQYACMLYSANVFFFPFLFSTTVHYLTTIAWERHVAVKKWMD